MGLVGLAVGAWTDAALVRLTDGDAHALPALRRNVELNRAWFGDTAVDASVLAWEGDACARPEQQPYDVILCADCVYDHALHTVS